MGFIDGLLLITAVHLLAAASPGPDFVLVSQQSIRYGRSVGLWCSLGITLGLGVHIAYSIMGLAMVITHSHSLLTAIKMLGGLYLLYLGWQGIRAKPMPSASQAATPKHTATAASELSPTAGMSVTAPSRILPIVKQGFFCNVLNPKAPVYFVAVFTLVLSPNMPFWQLASYGVWMMVIQMAWFSTVVWILSLPTVQQRFRAIEHWIDRILGAAMLGLGLKLLLIPLDAPKSP